MNVTPCVARIPPRQSRVLSAAVWRWIVNAPWRITLYQVDVVVDELVGRRRIYCEENAKKLDAARCLPLIGALSVAGRIFMGRLELTACVARPALPNHLYAPGQSYGRPNSAGRGGSVRPGVSRCTHAMAGHHCVPEAWEGGNVRGWWRGLGWVRVDSRRRRRVYAVVVRWPFDVFIDETIIVEHYGANDCPQKWMQLWNAQRAVAMNLQRLFVCLSVCLSVTRRRQNGWTDPTQTLFSAYATLFKGNSGIFVHTSTSFWAFSLNSILRKFSPQYVHRRRVLQTTTVVSVLLTTPGDDGESGLSTSTDNCRLLVTFGVQLCARRDGRLGVKQRRADPSASADTCNTICTVCWRRLILQLDL